MLKAELNKELIATVAGNITVFNYDGETREYLSSSVEYLAQGVGIPANSCIDEPGEKKEGFAICRTADFTAWEYVADHRGETVYSTETGEALAITVPGDYLENTTTVAPATSYDTWNGSEWVTDMEAQNAGNVAAVKAEKQYRIDQANVYMNSKQWPGKAAIGRLKGEELDQYGLWLDYLDALEAVDTSNAPDINWPVPPEL